MCGGPLYTVAEIERALELKALGLTWAQVAGRMGRSEKSLVVTACRYRLGKWQASGKALDWQERRTRIIARAERGERLGALARAEGVTVHYASYVLTNAGIDGEMRRLYRAEARA
jgi:hypothetical protein